MNYFFVFIFAWLNRARGSRLFDHTDSTIISRLVTMMAMALLLSLNFIGDNVKMLEIFLWIWAALIFWCTPAWDEYWGAAIGKSPIYSRIWGLFHMAYRMAYLAPCVIGLAYLTHGNSLWALATPLLALPYFIFGYVDKNTAVPRSEYVIGGMIAVILQLAMSQS